MDALGQPPGIRVGQSAAIEAEQRVKRTRRQVGHPLLEYRPLVWGKSDSAKDFASTIDDVRQHLGRLSGVHTEGDSAGIPVGAERRHIAREGAGRARCSTAARDLLVGPVR